MQVCSFLILKQNGELLRKNENWYHRGWSKFKIRNKQSINNRWCLRTYILVEYFWLMFQTKTDGHYIINCIEAETEWIARVRAVCGSISSDQMYCNFLGLGWWFLRLRAGVVIYNATQAINRRWIETYYVE